MRHLKKCVGVSGGRPYELAYKNFLTVLATGSLVKLILEVVIS